MRLFRRRRPLRNALVAWGVSALAASAASFFARRFIMSRRHQM